MIIEIVVGIAFAVTAVVSVVLCVCGKSREKHFRYANGNRAEDNNNDKRDDESVAVRARNNRTGNDCAPDSLESTRPKTLTINRKLPEIPHSAVDADILTDLYATVDETSSHKTPTASSTALNDSVASSSAPLQATQQNVVSPSDPSHSETRATSKYEQERHNYAKIKGQCSDDRDVDTDTYCDPHVYAGTSDTAAAAANGSADSASVYEPPPPPVPEKYYELVLEVASEPLTTTATPTQHVSSSPTSSAASAIAGNPSIADIPFMTSPIPPNQNLPYLEDSDTYQRTDDVIQEIRYTSISVREPLANIRAQMSRPQLLSATAVVPTTTSAAVLVESHYSIVPEDGDQTYAEIESAQHSTTSSMTYSRIDAPNVERVAMSPPAVPTSSTHYPPAPPTVESLRTVAQAHSRHTSSSSCISDYSHHNSPATERRCDLNDATGDGRSSASPDFGAIYSVVDKSKKSRATVHVMEQDFCGFSSDGGKRSSSAAASGPGSGTIEDMYAKVFKKRDLALSKFRPTTMMEGIAVDLGYENVRSVQTHQQQHQHQLSPAVLFNGVEIRKKKNVTAEYLVQPDPYSFDDSGTNSDPGYEVVKSKKPQAAANANTFPNYETINGDFKDEDDGHVDGLDDDDDDDDDDADESEIGYEVVSNNRSTVQFSRSDPNYESVRYTGVSSSGGGGGLHDETAAAAAAWSDALYERINGREDDEQSDPNYEKVKTVSESSYEASEPGYERVKPKRNPSDVAEDGYERIRGPFVSRRPAAEPGYELIKNRTASSTSASAVASQTASEEKEEDDVDLNELYAVPSKRIDVRAQPESSDELY